MLARFVVNSHIHHHPTNTNRDDDTETFKIPNTTSAEPLPQVTPCSPYYVCTNVFPSSIGPYKSIDKPCVMNAITMQQCLC